MENNVDVERTFQSKMVPGLDIVLSKSNSAYFHITYLMKNVKGYECKVKSPLFKFQDFKNQFLLILYFQFQNVWTSRGHLYDAAPVVRKNSPYKRFFKEAIMKMKENGDIDKFKRNIEQSKKVCSTGRSQVRALSIMKLISLFVWLVFGVLLSFGLGLVERLYHQIMTKEQASKTSSMIQEQKEMEKLTDDIIKMLPHLPSGLKNEADCLIDIIERFRHSKM